MAVLGDASRMEGRAPTIPVHRTVPRLARDTLGGFEEIAREADGAVVRLHLGLVRPFLVTDPDHVQHVLRDEGAQYLRDGMLWKPLRRLNGNGIAGDGPAWAESRALFQSLFAVRHISSLVEQMAAVVAEGVDALDGRARAGTPVDLQAEMTRLVHGVLVRVLFGDHVSLADAERLGAAINTAFASMGARMALPFVPAAVPMPGDRAFHRAVRTVDEIIFPLVEERLRRPTGESDMVAQICEARDKNGTPRDAQLIRDDLVAIFIAGTETTALALTWLWVVLDRHPDVATRLETEVENVLGGAAPNPSHLPGLQYTKAVMQEVLRLYPAGWILPRTVKTAHQLGGVSVPAGATVLLSPYLTHRMEKYWPRPDVFEPERFLPERSGGRHRFAYFPFGGGPHVCLGQYFYTVEVQLIVAALLSRYQVLPRFGEVKPQPAPSLRPATKVEVIFRPR